MQTADSERMPIAEPRSVARQVVLMNRIVGDAAATAVAAQGRLKAVHGVFWHFPLVFPIFLGTLPSKVVACRSDP